MPSEVTTLQLALVWIDESRAFMKRVLKSFAVACSLLLPTAVVAQATPHPGTMSVAVFMAKAEALRAQGMMALFSSDYGVLKAEVTGSAQAFRRQIKAEAATGKPSACPPERAALTSDDILAHMRSYPETRRARVPVSEAVADLFRKRFPCPSR